MRSVAVVIPWRGGCQYRERARRWVRDRYREHHPDWPVILSPGPDPWIKAEAVMPAVEQCDAEIVVVADADVWTTGLSEAVCAIEAGEGWAIPHRTVHRLTEQATSALLRGDPAEDLEQPPYKGVPGGGLVVATRETLLTVPLDPRFVGWGQEDESWSRALYCLLGPPWRGDADLIHLWHPPQRRTNRRKGSEASWQLFLRYRRARRHPDQMFQLIQEAQCLLSQAS